MVVHFRLPESPSEAMIACLQAHAVRYPHQNRSAALEHRPYNGDEMKGLVEVSQSNFVAVYAINALDFVKTLESLGARTHVETDY
jgi:hypothetical protein